MENINTIPDTLPFSFSSYINTRGLVHKFMHRWGSPAWLAIGADWSQSCLIPIGAGQPVGGTVGGWPVIGGWLWKYTNNQGTAPALRAWPPVVSTHHSDW